MSERNPILRIELGGNVPAYRQIVETLRTHLVNGELRAGDQLPPVRQLAEHLGIHFNTVAEAYRILADEGWLDLKRRRGALILDRKQPAKSDPAVADSFAKRVRELVAEVRALGVPQSRIARELRSVAEALEK